jgi:hypothetical protein
VAVEVRNVEAEALEGSLGAALREGCGEREAEGDAEAEPVAVAVADAVALAVAVAEKGVG